MRFLQHLYRLIVGDAGKRSLDFLQFRNIAANGLQVGTAAFETSFYQKAQQPFGERHYVIELCVSDLGLDHPELGQVAASFTFLGAEGGSERIDFAQRHGGCFDVELPGLSQVGLLVEIINGK